MSEYLTRGVTYADAETRGRLRVWKNKLARNYVTFDKAYTSDELKHLAVEMVKCPRAGRKRAFEKINTMFGPGVTLETVNIAKRNQSLAVWSILKPRNSVAVTEDLIDLPDDKIASLSQDCVTVNYVLIGTSDILVAEGTWTLEVPDHALGRAVERSRLLHPEVIIREAHLSILGLPNAVLQQPNLTDDEAGAYIKAGAGCFAGYLRMGPDVSIGYQYTLHVRVKTWIDDDQLFEDQIALSGKGEPGDQLGDGWFKPQPLRHIQRTGDTKFECLVRTRP